MDVGTYGRERAVLPRSSESSGGGERVGPPRVRHGRPRPTACASDVFDVLCGPVTTCNNV